MSEKIPQDFIKELLYKTNIIDVIGGCLKLKKKGSNYLAFCPFHQEKTPSFTVNFEKQFYYCFGCNNHGNAIDFLMNFNHLNFLDSIKELSIRNGLEQTYYNFFQPKNNFYTRKNYLYDVNNAASIIYKNNLFSERNLHILNYLKKRGINQNILNLFCIGYSESNIQSFLMNFKKTGFDKKKLVQSGILVINEKREFDRFYKRIIFPIRNIYGKITGFGGRVIDERLPKYINSPETLIFSKKTELYGLYELKKKSSSFKQLIIVEGYIDVIILFQCGINYAVSTLGTSITRYQIKILFQKTNNIIYCYDGDDAGKKAAWSALKATLPYILDGKTVKFIFLPKGEDPDSIIRKKGKIFFEKKIKEAIPLSTFLFHVLLKNINLLSIDERSKIIVKALPLISQIPSVTTKLLIQQTLSHKLGIVSTYKSELFKNKEFIFNKRQTINRNLQHNTMRILIGLLVQYPKLVRLVSIEKYLNKKIKLTGLKLFINIISICLNDPGMNTGQLLEFYRNNEKFLLKIKKISKWDHMITQSKIECVFLDALKDLDIKILCFYQDTLLAKERLLGLNQNEKLNLWSINKRLFQFRKSYKKLLN
ncbi:DNA primase [Buchnera aphidicola (Thelaxes suberi)]|uniref:DNA primase n=1 Tax=Buchnera aphidicola TaxID=9 RepID=UPI0034649D52